ncbi:23S rRNA (uracil(1939)-C(5))-methyltransferase RlmD [Halalkalibacter hemicellulosilyticus]|uniref:RNA methyltransferase n=1 Tax=Halalkalibacter hemicellulosilyticusJCM 9152 TaxID=1236971 RepID=W4QG89_9BACI|nr:23S rRNA (uracil(1939)-C(5))-methyltransferase RlmD [Halalkalibacter hemicellulosilyticus]GAE31120.1 RNA methyltransferase [Halalkalibacter hemicellulosilyticusJCM 9152]
MKRQGQSQNMKSNQMEKGQKFPLTIKRLGINGEGVGYFKKQVVFVRGALPGEEVVAEAEVIHPRYTEAKVLKTRKKSSERIDPPCPVYEKCGGCQLQHMNYEATLAEKRSIVLQAFERHTKLNIDTLNIQPTIGMDNPWHYRNKSQMQVKKEGKFVRAGLYARNSHELVDLSECPIQHKAINRVTRVVKQILTDLNVSIYQERKHKGAIRSVVSRVAFETGEIQVVLVTKTNDLPRQDAIIAEINQRLPEVKSIVHNVNEKKTSLIFGDQTKVIAGNRAIVEKLGSRSVALSARAFFQLNPVQTEKLYNKVKEVGAFTGKEKVVDAYCGVGTIGLWIADQVAEVRGMDVIAEAIEDAKMNAQENGYHHLAYEVGKAENLLPKWIKQGWKPDVIIVDPPRVGCDKQLLQTIKKVKPKKIIYVSCNPATLAKDVEELRQENYAVKSIQPVDMFPWTAQVENVVVLEVKN